MFSAIDRSLLSLSFFSCCAIIDAHDALFSFWWFFFLADESHVKRAWLWRTVHLNYWANVLYFDLSARVGQCLTISFSSIRIRRQILRGAVQRLRLDGVSQRRVLPDRPRRPRPLLLPVWLRRSPLRRGTDRLRLVALRPRHLRRPDPRIPMLLPARSNHLLFALLRWTAGPSYFLIRRQHVPGSTELSNIAATEKESCLSTAVVFNSNFTWEVHGRTHSRWWQLFDYCFWVHKDK